jgi:hypothetical protein
MPPVTNSAQSIWELPPLILHPFNEHTSPSSLLENSKTALMLSGLLPNDGASDEELRRKLLAGRYAEIRMLFFLGRDVFRWIDQCFEMVSRTPALQDRDYKPQSFAGLAAAPPPSVREKLIQWGVADYNSVFRRAIGLHAIFAEPPEFASLAEEFLREYYRYADLFYQGFMEAEPHRLASEKDFRFELYASGEYAKLLESEWSEE